ncbi:methionine ABC transporter ATP-binding protein [Lactococcus fujiensis]|uniref:ABC transporter ATP-binding protein n=1 Tax=Lactococcus fujiensis JCM 16395 TaxID=1291764 RepID=A0A2A5RMV8_9LACT|nr:methionine ABC transporter ATP-binding protein [Lactococcus fujiensis]PCS00667.1 ABC transporter ATP-binding protein [Lactococcus fujiensis JCM 16395]
MTNIIELNHLSVSFASKKSNNKKNGESNIIHAVEDATLHIEKGDIYGVIGYSGAGKSTLVRTINLLQKPTEGQIIINGEIVFDTNHPVHLSGAKLRAFRQKIGMIFQHFNLLAEKTVFNNVSFALQHTQIKDGKTGKLRYLSATEKKTKVENLLGLVELSELAHKYPSQLSGGQKQRVAIARALANDPEILISDEGTSALDPKTTNQILDLLKDLHDRLGLTIVLITHEMQVVKEIANKVAVMQNGRIIEQNSLIDIFAGPEEELTKQFIETTSSVNRFIAGLPRTKLLQNLAEDEELIHLDYASSELEDPVISDITKIFDVTTNIYYGNVELLQQQPFGSLVFTLKGSSEQRAAAKQYFNERNLKFIVLGSVKEGGEI